MIERRFDQIADEIEQRGWSLYEYLFDSSLTNSLYQECLGAFEHDLFTQAGIGRNQQFQVNNDIRNDKILWLENASPAQTEFLALMEQLRRLLNQKLFLGLFDFEAHFAVYPPGGFYKKHIDQFSGKRARVITTVTYLNPDWTVGNGGQLVIYDPQHQDQILATVTPKAGTFVCFMSENFPHEVLQANKQRASIAGWFRLRE